MQSFTHGSKARRLLPPAHTPITELPFLPVLFLPPLLNLDHVVDPECVFTVLR